jgi:hypothetical protein
VSSTLLLIIFILFVALTLVNIIYKQFQNLKISSIVNFESPFCVEITNRSSRPIEILGIKMFTDVDSKYKAIEAPLPVEGIILPGILAPRSSCRVNIRQCIESVPLIDNYTIEVLVPNGKVIKYSESIVSNRING